MKKIIIFLSVVLIFAVFAGCNASKQGNVSSAAPDESVADTGENASSSESAPDIDISGAESDAYIPGDDTSADQSEPETSTPEPETSAPESETSAPEVSQPEVSTPEASEPQVSQPEVSKPEVSEPEVSEPEVSEPEVSEPEVSEPEVSEPDEDRVLVRIPTPVVPAVTTPVWDGSIADGFASGTGTEDDPFIIETAAQLAYFALSVDEGNDYLGQFVKLANNIKLNDGNLNVKELADDVHLNKWNAIGERDYRFCGTFDGNNHVICGIYGSEGLFFAIKGTVKNVGITNSHIVGSGALANAASSGTAEIFDINVISNCYVVESVIEAEGGLLRSASGYSIDNCYNGATVYAAGDWNGGLIGHLYFSKIDHCYNAGTVYGGHNFAGGLIGNLGDSNVSNCYNVGIVYGDLSPCGVVAINVSRNTFENCGYLEGTAEYAIISNVGVVSTDEIIVLTEEQIDY